MIADLIPRLAEFENEENLPYSPRISMAGPMHARGEDTRCIRSMCFHRAGVPASPLPGRALLIFDDSNWHEQLTADWLRKSIFKVHSEQMHVNVDLGLPFLRQRTCKTKISGQPCGQIIPAGHIAGHMDFLLGNPEGKDILIEHKAINHFTFERIWRGEIPLDYVFQTSLYLQGLQPINPIDYALLLIKNKNNSAYVEIEIEYIPENQHVVINGMMRSNGDYQDINKRIAYSVVAESAAKFGEVEERFQSKTLPPRPYEMDHWRCLSGDTLVKVSDGWKSLRDVGVNDFVLGSDGSYHPVENKRSLVPDKPILRLRAYSLLPIIGTEDHQFLVERRISRGGRKKFKMTPVAEWMSMAEIKSATADGRRIQLLSVFDKRVNPAKILSAYEINFLGLYITEGCLSNEQRGIKYRVEFCLNRSERDLAELIRSAARELWGAKAVQRIITDPRNGNQYMKVVVNSRDAVEFIEKYVHVGHAPQKSFKESIMVMPPSYQEKLLQIMIRGDGCGCLTRGQPTVVYSTTSKILALQVQTFYLRMGLVASINPNQSSSKSFGSSVCYHVRHYPSAKHNYGFIEDGFFKVPIHKITESNLEEVFDISVGETHDFQTEGGIAHNCAYCQYHEGCWEGYDKEFEALATDVAMAQDLEETCKYYLELHEHWSSMGKEKEELRDKIIKAMKDKGLRKGYTELYNATLSLRKWTGIDNDLIPPKILEAATISKPFEMLTIRLRNQPKKSHKSKETK